tara:strand:- start:14009 stop:14722 length:714 start_codon:yes stop_codon:yes gene_type:complete
VSSPDNSFVLHFDEAGGLDYEAARFEAVSSMAAATQQLHFWQQARCLVVPRAYSQRRGIEAAVEDAADLGWPVFFRASGGSCVFHGENVLCITQLVCEPCGSTDLNDTYRRFTTDLLAAVSALGISAGHIGVAPNAPCDGRFNILVNGRKLAGTAMRRRTVSGMDTSLVHACLWLRGPFTSALNAIEAFETRLGIGNSYPPAACISLAEATGRNNDASDLLAKDWACAMQSLVHTTY